VKKIPLHSRPAQPFAVFERIHSPESSQIIAAKP